MERALHVPVTVVVRVCHFERGSGGGLGANKMMVLASVVVRMLGGGCAALVWMDMRMITAGVVVENEPSTRRSSESQEQRERHRCAASSS